MEKVEARFLTLTRFAGQLQSFDPAKTYTRKVGRTAKIIVKERFNVSLSFTATRPSQKTLDRSFTNYII